jgi:cytochrome b6-f complex iron-sulfur subunit
MEKRTPIDGALDRRRLMARLGWGGLGALAALAVPALVRFLLPRPGQDGRATFDAGAVQDYRATRVSTRWVDRHRCWIVRRGSHLIALEARCTHLGCTPRWMASRSVFRCPCHGSCFTTDGDALNGPATAPLQRLAVRAEKGRLFVNTSVRVPQEDAEQDPRFSVPLGTGPA